MSQNLDSLSVRTYDRNVLLVKCREGKIKSPYTVSTVGLPTKPCSLYLIQYQSLDIVFQGCLKSPYSVSIVGLPKKLFLIPYSISDVGYCVSHMSLEDNTMNAGAFEMRFILANYH